MASLEPYTCKHCGKQTMQFEKMDIHFKQRQYITSYNITTQAADRDIRHEDVPVFLCDDCLQSYVDAKNNNKAFTRRGMIVPTLLCLTVLLLPLVVDFFAIDFEIVKLVLVGALIVFGIYLVVPQTRIDTSSKHGITSLEKWTEKDRNENQKALNIAKSLIPCVIGIALIFLPDEASLIVIGLIWIFALLSFFTSAYSLIRGHKKSKIESGDFHDAITYYFKVDDNIDLIEEQRY